MVRVTSRLLWACPSAPGYLDATQSVLLNMPVHDLLNKPAKNESPVQRWISAYGPIHWVVPAVFHSRSSNVHGAHDPFRGCLRTDSALMPQARIMNQYEEQITAHCYERSCTTHHQKDSFSIFPCLHRKQIAGNGAQSGSRHTQGSQIRCQSGQHCTLHMAYVLEPIQAGGRRALTTGSMQGA